MHMHMHMYMYMHIYLNSKHMLLGGMWYVGMVLGVRWYGAGGTVGTVEGYGGGVR